MSMYWSIPESAWEKCGDEDNPAARLLAYVRVNGCGMHVEAVEVTPWDSEGGQRVIDAPGWIEDALGASADWEPVETVEIFGKPYALIFTPGQL